LIIPKAVANGSGQPTWRTFHPGFEAVIVNPFPPPNNFGDGSNENSRRWYWHHDVYKNFTLRQKPPQMKNEMDLSFSS
jgi:hypothetical protein